MTLINVIQFEYAIYYPCNEKMVLHVVTSKLIYFIYIKKKLYFILLNQPKYIYTSKTKFKSKIRQEQPINITIAGYQFIYLT